MECSLGTAAAVARTRRRRKWYIGGFVRRRGSRWRDIREEEVFYSDRLRLLGGTLSTGRVRRGSLKISKGIWPGNTEKENCSPFFSSLSGLSIFSYLFLTSAFSEEHLKCASWPPAPNEYRLPKVNIKATNWTAGWRGVLSPSRSMEYSMLALFLLSFVSANPPLDLTRQRYLSGPPAGPA